MDKKDLIIVGGGIMGATMAAIYNELFPDSKILILERLDRVAEESSKSWNNAGTGHSGFCELNYTPIDDNGNIKMSKAIKVAEQFELSKQFWAYMLEKGHLDSTNLFLRKVPHCSLVFGEENKEFLKKRVEKMKTYPLFEGMKYTEDIDEMKEWFPLIMNGRTMDKPMAASKMDIGTDVNFGLLTTQLFDYLKSKENIELLLEHEVYDIDRNDDGSWKTEYKDLKADHKDIFNSKYVFVGAGGGALRLLNKAEIREIDGYGGFPVGGKWLKCNNPEVIESHNAKVYGLAEIGAPPMSVPHLDSRMIDDKKELLFGPYAGFNTKFLKHGSYLDLPKSIDFDNIIPMMEAGLDNLPLTKYLIDQVLMSFEEKFEALKKYYPEANEEDWEVVHAGQRVQIIKDDENGEGVLEFGTEIIVTEDRSLSGLLGASPGASTASAIMLDLIVKMFNEEIIENNLEPKIKEIFPSYKESLVENPELLKSIRNRCHKVLNIQ